MVGAVAAALLVRWAANPLLGSELPFSAAFANVVLVARYLGSGPAIAAAVLGGLGSEWIVGGADRIYRMLYLVGCALTIQVIGVLLRSRERAEAAAEHAAQLRAIVESSSAAIYSTSLDGSIRTWNLGAEKVFGYAPNDAIGQPVSRLLPPGAVTETSSAGQPSVEQIETTRVRQDGTEIQVALTVSPIYDSAGKPCGISYIAHDITRQKRFEEEVREMQRLESLGVLAGGIAHDFNNLLTGIVGNASLALDSTHDPELGRRISEVLEASERAAVLVGQMLAFAGKGNFVVRPVDLSAEVKAILPLFRSSIPSGVEVHLQLAPSLPLIDADRAQIQQIIMNLTINAAEAMNGETGSVFVTTRARHTNNAERVILEVKDTGSGMPEEVRSRIFEPFFTTKFQGRGLGLSAVVGIVHRHKGTIQVESIPNYGSTFVVEFPASPSTKAVEPPGERDASGLRGSGLVLVVDDEELVRNMAAVTLEQFGYSVEVASGGLEGVERFERRATEFTAVLLDLTMPAVGGDETLRRILKLRPAIPIVLSSGFSEADARARFHSRERAEFLQKPYTARALAQALVRAINNQPYS